MQDRMNACRRCCRTQKRAVIDNDGERGVWKLTEKGMLAALNN
jgi:hypothetical protein